MNIVTLEKYKDKCKSLTGLVRKRLEILKNDNLIKVY